MYNIDCVLQTGYEVRKISIDQTGIYKLMLLLAFLLIWFLFYYVKSIFIYIAQYHKSQFASRGFIAWHTIPSALRPSNQMTKNSPEKPFNRWKKGKDGQTSNRCRVYRINQQQNHSVYSLKCRVWNKSEEYGSRRTTSSGIAQIGRA